MRKGLLDSDFPAKHLLALFPCLLHYVLHHVDEHLIYDVVLDGLSGQPVEQIPLIVYHGSQFLFLASENYVEIMMCKGKLHHSLSKSEVLLADEQLQLHLHVHCLWLFQLLRATPTLSFLAIHHLKHTSTLEIVRAPAANASRIPLVVRKYLKNLLLMDFVTNTLN